MKTVPWAATCGTHCFALAPKVPFHLLDAHRRHINPGMWTTQAPLSVKVLLKEPPVSDPCILASSSPPDAARDGHVRKSPRVAASVFLDSFVVL